MKKIFQTLRRLVFWLPVVINDLPESGETYGGIVSAFVSVGIVALIIPTIAMFMPTVGIGWWELLLSGFSVYLAVGLGLHFTLKDSFGSYI